MRHYPDGYLEYWGDIFVSRQLFHQGLTFEQFLVAPADMLARVERAQAHAVRTADDDAIMHRQERRELHQLRQRGPLLIQKLWHGSRRRNRADAPLPSRR